MPRYGGPGRTALPPAANEFMHPFKSQQPTGYGLLVIPHSPTPLPFPAVLRVNSPVDWPATERD